MGAMGQPLREFLTGVLAGALVSAVAVSGLVFWGTGADTTDAADQIGRFVVWVWTNLGFSLPVFGLLLLLYVASLARLRGALTRSAPADEVRQADHLGDVWTSLFFGVGVIWTAIGMRGALVEALAGDAAGGVEVLERMIDGGILMALSTTIFGGVGGYLMRAWKALTVGAELARYYERESSRDLVALRASVSGIEYRLRTGAEAGREGRQ
jgi:hypothetical protein